MSIVKKSLNLCTDPSHLKHTWLLPDLAEALHVCHREATNTFDTILLLTRLATTSISKVMVGRIQDQDKQPWPWPS